MKKIIILISILIYCYGVWGQKNSSNIARENKDYKNPKIFLRTDSTLISTTDSYHPYLFESLSFAERDSFQRLIHTRKLEMAKDSVTITEYIHIWKPLLDRLLYEDPHYRILPFPKVLGKKLDENRIHVVPVSLLIINDTVIVDKSCDTIFHKGDRILSVNGVSIIDYLNNAYRDRYSYSYVLQQYYHFAFAPHYKVEIERNGRKQEVETAGRGYKKNQFELRKGDWRQEMFDNHKAGYIVLNKFYPNNSVLIRKLTSFIKKVKKAGYKNVIIDVRRNGGGNGDRFDHLISLFTNEDSLYHVKGQQIRCSKSVLEDYDFLKEEMIGELVEFPNEYANKVIPLKPEKYLGGMNYYILISRNTASIAASFVNILQTNNWAKLVGEPLMHNALKYGEVIYQSWGSRYNRAVYSTVAIDNYTRSPDGQVYPDVEIPFVASEYMKGGDPVLEKLLEYIQKENNK